MLGADFDKVDFGPPDKIIPLIFLSKVLNLLNFLKLISSQ